MNIKKAVKKHVKKTMVVRCIRLEQDLIDILEAEAERYKMDVSKLIRAILKTALTEDTYIPEKFYRELKV